MSSIWRSRILNTQVVAGAWGWYHENLPSGETLPPIKAAEEEESAKRLYGKKSRTSLKKMKEKRKHEELEAKIMKVVRRDSRLS
jgi:hypothetical protein